MARYRLASKKRQEDVFKPSENMIFCAVKNCELNLNDLLVCPLHHRTLLYKLKETKVATIAPKDFGDVYLAKRVWGTKLLLAQVPLDLLSSYFRAHTHLESLALHNRDVDNWADRSFWKNKELVLAVESVIKHFSPRSYDFFEIQQPVPSARAVESSQGEALVWKVVPGQIDYRNDPNSDFNIGRDESQSGGWKTQVMREEFSPSLGDYSGRSGRRQNRSSSVSSFSVSQSFSRWQRLLSCTSRLISL
jgi:hypothetical protein